MSGLRVFVTGGGRGIGRAIALRFAREGAQVAIAARSSDELDRVVAEIEAAGGKGRACVTNVADQGSVEAAVYRAVEFHGGGLDVLVNNAGIWEVKPFEKLDTGSWKRQMEVNLFGPFYVTLEALDALRESRRAHVFNIASIAARQGFPGNVAYCASKYGLRGFSDALRCDLASRGIRVSTVYPGPTDTTVFDKAPGEWNRERMNKPDDVAEVIWRAYNAAPGEKIDDLDVPPRT